MGVLSLMSQYQSLSVLDIYYFTAPPPVKKKNKLISMILYRNKALMNFHHSSPNSHVPGINYLELLANTHSITSHHS